MIIHNPYDNRLAVTNPREFYDRMECCANVLKRVCAPSGQSCSLVGETRIGKSSLLRYLAHPEGAAANPVLRPYIGNPSDHLFVLVELQTLPVRTPLALWRHIFARIADEAARQCGNTGAGAEAFPRAAQSSDDYEVQVLLEEYLHGLPRRVVLLLDDFEVVVQGFSKADAARATGKLRALAQSALSLAIASSDPLTALFHRAGLDSEPSPLHNILFTESLGLMEAQGARALILEPLQKRAETAVSFSSEDVEWLMGFAGRHPDLLKVSCYHLFNAKARGEADRNAAALIIERDPHVRALMSQLWARIAEAQDREGIPFLEALASAARGVQPADSLALLELRNRGLVDTSNGAAVIFSELFRQRVLAESAGSPLAAAPVPQPAIQVETADRKAQIGGQTLSLTALEFRLFQHLADNLNRTCTREELRRALWGGEPPASGDALEQLVKRLRRKIEADPGRPQRLISVRGQGYLLRDTPR